MIYLLVFLNIVALLVMFSLFKKSNLIISQVHRYKFDKQYLEDRYSTRIKELNAKVYAYEQLSWHLGYKISEYLNKGDVKPPIFNADKRGFALLGLYQKKDGQWNHQTYSHFVKRELEGRDIKSNDVNKYDMEGNPEKWEL